MCPSEYSFSLQITLDLVARTLIPCCSNRECEIGPAWAAVSSVFGYVLHEMLSSNTIHPGFTAALCSLCFVLVVVLSVFTAVTRMCVFA